MRVPVRAYMCASCRNATENITKCHRANILDGESLSTEYFNGCYLIIYKKGKKREDKDLEIIACCGVLALAYDW